MGSCYDFNANRAKRLALRSTRHEDLNRRGEIDLWILKTRQRKQDRRSVPQ